MRALAAEARAASARKPLLEVQRSGQAFRTAARQLPGTASHPARGRWRGLRRVSRRDRRPGGRVRLRQVDAGARGDAADRTDRWPHRVRRPGHHASQPGGDPSVAPAHADDLPGPLRVAQSAHDGGRDPRRPVAPARPGPATVDTRAGAGIAGSGRTAADSGGAVSARILRRTAAAHFDRARAGGGARASSSATNRSRRWTSTSRRRSST